jgi:ribosome maturation factor RimP
MTVTDRVRHLVDPVLADLGLEIYDIEQLAGTLRITVDRAGGIDLESLALATRVVSRELDQADPIPGRYTLEVSSPGLERVLRTAEHFQRAIGSEVAVRTHPRDGAPRRLTGVLTAAEDDAIVVTVPDAVASEAGDAAPGEHRVRYDDIDRCRTVFRWGAAPKPSPSRRKPRAATAANKRPGREGRD